MWEKDDIIFVVFCDIVKLIAHNIIAQVDCVLVSRFLSQIYLGETFFRIYSIKRALQIGISDELC